MSEGDAVVVYAGQYDSIEVAKSDFELIKALKHEKFLGRYESALFMKTADGKIQVIDTDSTQRAWGAKVGLVTGAVLGVVFPPSVLLLAATGAGVGAAASNLTKIMSGSNVKEIADLLDEGQAGVVLIAETTIEEGTERLLKNAAKEIKHQIDADADAIKAAVDEAVDTAAG